jgi:hypothetical protein
MAICEIQADGFQKVVETSFSAAGIRERADLQRLLRANVAVISPDTLVIAEEFGEWEDSRRRIDLLGIDKAANLVVIELKRDEDGGHMELQAIRYAAMVSTMTFERAVEVYAEHLGQTGSDLDPRSSLMEFLEWDEPDEDSFAQHVRIVLASADFSRELTTAVMWLNDQGLDIRCVRIKPYLYGETILVDVQQVIPLPEAEDYRVRFKEKQQRERAARKMNLDLTKYDVTVGGQTQSRLSKRATIYAIVKFLCDSGIAPEEIAAKVPGQENRMFRSTDGVLDSAAFAQRMRQAEEGRGKRFESHRFFCADGQLIHTNGRTYACTNQWGGGANFLTVLNDLKRAFPDHQIEYAESEDET